jgi:hypothetical protein
MSEAGECRWLVTCRDAAGRSRHLAIHVIGDGRVALQVPPGESAFLQSNEIEAVCRYLVCARRISDSMPGDPHE